MAAQLNIKDEDLAGKLRALAREDGNSVTATMRLLVDEEIRRRDTERALRLERMTAFTKELQASVPAALRGVSSKEIMDSIYDDEMDDGLAR